MPAQKPVVVPESGQEGYLWWSIPDQGNPLAYKILLGFVALIVLAIPLRVWFGWSATLGYLFRATRLQS